MIIIPRLYKGKEKNHCKDPCKTLSIMECQPRVLTVAHFCFFKKWNLKVSINNQHFVFFCSAWPQKSQMNLVFGNKYTPIWWANLREKLEVKDDEEKDQTVFWDLLVINTLRKRQCSCFLWKICIQTKSKLLSIWKTSVSGIFMSWKPEGGWVFFGEFGGPLLSQRDADVDGEGSSGVGPPQFYETLQKNGIHPWRLTWNIIMEVCKIIFLSKRGIGRFHVNLPGCNPNINWCRISSINSFSGFGR